MRAAREAAGISLREMARQMGYHSHTTLSAYECGAVMPTDEAVTAYEQILSLDPGTLTVIWFAPASLEAVMSANRYLVYQFSVLQNRFPRTF